MMTESKAELVELIERAILSRWPKLRYARETAEVIYDALLAAGIVGSRAPEGWVLVPKEPTEAMVAAGLCALAAWRKLLSSDEAILRRSAPTENGRVFLASATPEEKAVIRYRAMLEAAPPPPSGGVPTLFDNIKHGDAAHQTWLKEAIDDHFAGRPVKRPAPPLPLDGEDRG